MKILQCHNAYIYPGGEDMVAQSEAALLSSHGHEVIEYKRSNHELTALPPARRLKFYLKDIYSSKSTYQDVRTLIETHRPQVAHFHNSFFMIGPAAYQACFDAGLPVVQTLHNYRFLCAAGTFFREGAPCEKCLSHGRLAGIVHRCWHGSATASFLMTQAIESYFKAKILKKIDRFVALSEFSRGKFIQAGWDKERMTTKPNFLEKDPGQAGFQGKFILYIGALQPYKGVALLLAAWRSKKFAMPLKLVGTGPLQAKLQEKSIAGVEWLGQRPASDVIDLIKQAACVVVPSECYENFPRVVIEAYACGIPVVASDLGAMKEIVIHRTTGLLFKPGEAEQLALQLEFLQNNVDDARRMGRQARQVFENNYSAAAQYPKIMSLYNEVIGCKNETR
jgi:glycosyltransferase involved in cell wall biosynthesis